jgi:hypothetical protein
VLPSEDELKAIANDLEANHGKARAMIDSYIMCDAFSKSHWQWDQAG